MRRRDFITLAGGAAIAARTCGVVLAAQKSPIARIGYLSILPPPADCCVTPECKSVRWEACQSVCPLCWLITDLHEFGWRAGENLQIEARSSKGDLVNLPRLALELVSLRPDVLIALGSDETKALQAHTSDIPIVFINSSDPVGYGLVDSIARPGKNITGQAVAPQILWGKRLGLLVELFGHRPAKVTMLSNPEAVSAKPSLVDLIKSAEKLRIEVERWDVRKPDDLERVFAATAGTEAVLVQWLALTIQLRGQIAELAMQHLLPSVYEVREYVIAGGLMSYGLDIKANLRLTATYVDRILRGSQPKDLPVEQASKFQLVINLKTAKAMGITVPQMLLGRADEVIE